MPNATDTAGHQLDFDEVDQLSVDTIRGLAMDMVQAANSGHPGTPMGVAPAAYVLWNRFLRFDPADPIWPNRDRFVLSEGHASVLLWSLLHLAGVHAVDERYEVERSHAVTKPDIETFRQLGSHCPGHPEYRWTTGVETTTGPLGQGLATSVGMALAGRWQAERYNSGGRRAVRLRRLRARRRRLHDGGHLLGGSVARRAPGPPQPLLDLRLQPGDHRGSHRPAFTEDVAARFIAYGWNVTTVADVNDLASVVEGVPHLPGRDRSTDARSCCTATSATGHQSRTARRRTARRSARRRCG